MLDSQIDGLGSTDLVEAMDDGELVGGGCDSDVHCCRASFFLLPFLLSSLSKAIAREKATTVRLTIPEPCPPLFLHFSPSQVFENPSEAMLKRNR